MAGYIGSRAWRKVRDRILERDGGLCQVRLPGCLGYATSVDHIVPRMLGGGNDPGNLRACCVPCNSRLSMRSRTAVKNRGGASRRW